MRLSTEVSGDDLKEGMKVVVGDYGGTATEGATFSLGRRTGRKNQQSLHAETTLGQAWTAAAAHVIRFPEKNDHD